jgi:uncharacterized Fe-S cluster-containing radical SAM superfamily protein
MNVVTPIARGLEPAKFRDPETTAKGERRARVRLASLDVLWFNTGTLCNLTCRNCYIESSPRNDALVYLTAGEVAAYLDEIAALGWPTRQIGFTGGEPFMNPAFMTMVEDALGRGFEVLVLTNAMRPMMKCADRLLDARARHGDRLIIRVSVDHYARERHEQERGPRTWKPTIAGLAWLAANGFNTHVAGRTVWGEPEDALRAGFARLFAELGVELDARDPARLVLFPEMDARLDVPEITEACWGILRKTPSDVMCASSRMVVRRKGEATAKVVPCTLLPYDPRFDLGATLGEAAGTVALNHPHCARFCVLGGASCSRP